jgi:hypothetical protein
MAALDECHLLSDVFYRDQFTCQCADNFAFLSKCKDLLNDLVECLGRRSVGKLLPDALLIRAEGYLWKVESLQWFKVLEKVELVFNCNHDDRRH